MATKRKAKPRGLTATVVSGLMARRAQTKQAAHDLNLLQMKQAAEFHRFQLLRSVDQLRGLPNAEFERAVGGLLSALGYRNVLQVGGSGDLAADLTAIDAAGRTVVVQCKRKVIDQRIGSPEMQQFVGMVYVHHRAQRGIYVTTSGFRQPAIDLANASGIELWDADVLGRLLSQQHAPPQMYQVAPSVPDPDLYWWDGVQWRARV